MSECPICGSSLNHADQSHVCRSRAAVKIYPCTLRESVRLSEAVRRMTNKTIEQWYSNRPDGEQQIAIAHELQGA